MLHAKAEAPKNMIEKSQLQWAIEQHYRSIDRHYNQRINTKTWCVGIWATISLFSIYVVQGEPPLLGFFYSILAIALFWFLEAMQASHMKILELRVTELEKLWVNEESKIKDKRDILFYGSHQYQSSKVKLNLFVYALFRMETVFTFYLILVALSIVSLILKSVF